MTNATAGDPRRPAAMQAPGVDGDELRGRATGVVVGAVMGLAWASSTIPVLRPVVGGVVLTVSIAICAALMSGARRLRRAAVSVPTPASPAAGPDQVRRRFTLITAVEVGAVVAAGNVLSHAGRPLWIPAVICAIVGLHFIALARLFRSRLYGVTAAALCVIATTTMAAGDAGAPASVWRLLPGLGAALALWATSENALVTTVAPGRPSRSPAVQQ